MQGRGDELRWRYRAMGKLGGAAGKKRIEDMCVGGGGGRRRRR